MTLEFFDITEADVGKLMPIENACHSHPWSETLFKSCIGGRYFGAYGQQRQQAVGFYIGEYVAGEATLMDICVAPPYQGQGFGKALLQQFTAEARQLGAEKLWLEVRASNTSAQMLYINEGFIQTGRRTGYYPKQVGFEDAIVMCLTL